MPLTFLEDLSLALFLVCEYSLLGADLCKYFNRRNASRKVVNIAVKESKWNRKLILPEFAKASLNGKTIIQPADNVFSPLKKELNSREVTGT